MIINLENNQNIIDLSEDFINYLDKIVRETLYFEEVFIDCEINVLFVDNTKIRKFNFEYREIDKETDCLSFPMLHYNEKNVFKEQYKDFKFKDYELDDGVLLLGDILISLEKASAQGVEFNHGFEREVIYLLIHSILHLLGYDHIEEEDKIKMRVREKELIKRLKI